MQQCWKRLQQWRVCHHPFSLCFSKGSIREKAEDIQLPFNGPELLVAGGNMACLLPSMFSLFLKSVHERKSLGPAVLVSYQLEVLTHLFSSWSG